ncbi:MAG: HupE/UreJ family protein [Acidimicrobiia bacterium]|nr:HupE/UreJ family protein [Acidimicrobiia bacterium]
MTVHRHSPKLRRLATSGVVKRRNLAVVAPLAVVAVIVAFVLGPTSPAGAHTGDQSYLYLDVTQTTLGGRIEAPARDLRAALGLTLEGNDDEVMAELQANLDRLHAYFDEHLDIGTGGVDWTITFDGVDLFYSDLPEIDDNYVLFPFTVDVEGASDGDTVPRRFDVRFDPFFDEIEGRDALLLIGNDWQGGVIDNGASVYSAYGANSRSQQVDLGETGWVKNVVASAKLGVNHIKTGPDHILFVLVLLLPAVLVFTTGWEPAASFGAALWRVLKIVTMFTVAHSITFTLAGLDILPLPSSRIVESVIAISIAAAALHNIRPIAANKEWAISFAFGLFHGMGFASLVSGLDVDRSTQLVSLLGRNVGIEIGQAVVVLLLFPALFLLRRTTYYRPFFVGASVLLAAVSIGWMIERIIEIDLGVSGLVEPIVAWPEVLAYVAVLTVVAFGLERTERSRDRLLPVAGADDTDEVPVVTDRVSVP